MVMRAASGYLRCVRRRRRFVAWAHRQNDIVRLPARSLDLWVAGGDSDTRTALARWAAECPVTTLRELVVNDVGIVPTRLCCFIRPTVLVLDETSARAGDDDPRPSAGAWHSQEWGIVVLERRMVTGCHDALLHELAHWWHGLFIGRREVAVWIKEAYADIVAAMSVGDRQATLPLRRALGLFRLRDPEWFRFSPAHLIGVTRELLASWPAATQAAFHARAVLLFHFLWLGGPAEQRDDTLRKLLCGEVASFDDVCLLLERTQRISRDVANCAFFAHCRALTEALAETVPSTRV